MSANHIALVIGKRGSGKSYFVKNKLLPATSPLVVIDTMAEYPLPAIYTDLDAFLFAVQSGKVSKASLRFSSQAAIEQLFIYAYHFAPFTLVVEEIHTYCNPRYISPGLDRLIRFGRHRRINLVGISQRALDFPQILSTQVDTLILFKQRGVRDLEYLERFTGQDLAVLSNLPPYEYIVCRM